MRTGRKDISQVRAFDTLRRVWLPFLHRKHVCAILPLVP